MPNSLFSLLILFLSANSIVGLYVSFILLIGRFLRMGTINMHPSIQFRELPFVDRILKLCLNIYLVREMHEFRLEEDLYAQLVFLYRSSETLIKWTRRPQDPKKDDWMAFCTSTSFCFLFKNLKKFFYFSIYFFLLLFCLN